MPCNERKGKRERVRVTEMRDRESKNNRQIDSVYKRIVKVGGLGKHEVQGQDRCRYVYIEERISAYVESSVERNEFTHFVFGLLGDLQKQMD